MSDTESLLYTRLTGHAGLAALVDTRVYPMLLPQGATLPALTYQRVSGARTHNQSGTPILARPRIQIDCWAATYSGAKGLAAQVRAALDGWHAATGALASIVDNDIDDYDPETGRYRVIIDVLLWHVED